ncbi:hypothetical protein Lal_00031461, partial [Lupinus albus]
RTKSVADKNHPPPKKHKSGTSGQATPSFNRNKLTSLERQERGKVIRYDRDYLNMMLNKPYEVRDGHPNGYHQMVEQSSTMTHGFNIAETVETLCLPKRTVSVAVKGGKIGTMGFLSLIASPCARQGFQVSATEPIKKPITKKYIQQNCKEDTVEPQGQQPPQEPQIISHLEHLELQNDIIRKGAVGPSGLGDKDTSTDEE